MKKVLLVLGIIFGVLVVFFCGFWVRNTQLQEKSSDNQKNQVQAAPTIPCEPVGSKRCRELQELAKSMTPGPGPTIPCEPADSIRCLELNGIIPEPTPIVLEPIKIDLGALFRRPAPAPLSASQKAYEGIKSVPIIGDLIQGIEVIVQAIGWIFRNIWLILVVIVVISFISRIPVTRTFLIIWELTQTLWMEKSLKEAHRDRIKDLMGKKE